MRKEKNMSELNQKYRPEYFDFYANKDKTVSLILKNEEVKTGKLLCICPDEIVILDVTSPDGVTFVSETHLFDVSEIQILNN